MSVELGFMIFVGLMFYLVMAYDRFYKKHWPESAGDEAKKGGHRHKFSETNPATGLPMAGGGVDVGGNFYGSNNLFK
jgi:hypothetical protein